MSQQVSTNTFAVAKWVVSADATQGTHTTIGGALTSASSGDIIWIREGTYTENLTLKAGVFLVGSDQGQVTIVGKATMPTSGASTCNFQSLTLQTNADNLFTSAGSNVVAANFYQCNFVITNATGINVSNSGAASGYFFYNSQIFLTDGQAVFSASGGNLFFFNCECLVSSSGGSTANTISANNLVIRNSRFVNPITTSGTASCTLSNSIIDCGAANATCITSGGSGGTRSDKCLYRSGTATAIVANASTGSYNDNIDSTNAAVISGSNTLTYYDPVFLNTGSTISTTTQLGGTYKGVQTNTTPASGFLGEQIVSTVASGSPVSVTTTTSTNITSISLTPGVWDVNLVMGFGGGAITGTQAGISISTTSATVGTLGDNYITNPTLPTASSNAHYAIPQYRLSLSTTTTVYAVARCVYTVGSLTAYGRLSAVRVA